MLRQVVRDRIRQTAFRPGGPAPPPGFRESLRMELPALNPEASLVRLDIREAGGRPRIERIWPNLMNVVPKSSRANRKCAALVLASACEVVPTVCSSVFLKKLHP